LDARQPLKEGAIMKHARRVTQLCVAVLDEVALYALANDGSVWRYGTFKDIEYWSPLEPLPSEDPDTARHEKLCAALRQLGPSIGELTTAEVVNACRKAVADADSDEIMAALRAVGRPV
jgi:hypothetical protein